MPIAQISAQATNSKPGIGYHVTAVRHNMTLRIVAALGWLSVLGPINAQSPAAARLMNVNVVALDSHGKPVDDLTRDDFSIVDSGAPQKIVWFRHLPEQRHAVAVARNEFSNLRNPVSSNATAVLFDLLNEPLGARGNSWFQLVHYLETVEKPETVFVYILTVDGQIYTVHGPSGPQGDSGAEPWTRQIKPIMDNAMKAVTRARPLNLEADVAQRIKLTYDALGKVSAQLSGFPGRRNIVWVTDGVPMWWRAISGGDVDFTPQLRQLSATLQHLHAAVYPVRQTLTEALEAGNGETLNTLAQLTGGRPDEGRDIGAAITQAMSDLGSSYELGFYPISDNPNGQFHKLVVVSNRKGVRVQAPNGYSPSLQGLDALSREVIASASGAALDMAGIGLHGTLSIDEKKQTARLTAKIDARDVALILDGAKYTSHLRLAIVPRSADSREQSSSAADLRARPQIIAFDSLYSQAQRDNVLQQGIAFDASDLEVGNGVKSFRLVVFDVDSGSVGSLTIPISESVPGASR